MGKVYLWFLGGLAAFGVGVFALSQLVGFEYAHPRSRWVKRLPVNRQGAPVVPARVEQAQVGLPQAYVAEPTYDFGLMNPRTDGEHEFEIENHGTSPLTLRVKDTTCKCTVAGIEDAVLAPGEKTRVKLNWHTALFPKFEHSAILATNDPNLKTLRLKVVGKVRAVLLSDPLDVVVTNIDRGNLPAPDVRVYSETFADLSGARIVSTLPGLSWTWEPEAEVALPNTSAARLRLKLPADLPAGTTTGRITITMPPAEAGGAEESYDLGVRLATASRYAFYGEAIDSEGLIDLGQVSQGTAKVTRLTLKIREEDRDLHLQEIACTPDWVRAELKPVGADGAAKGLYALSLEAPADAPVGNYAGSSAGEVRIRTAHPALGTIVLKLQLAVVEPGS